MFHHHFASACWECFGAFRRSHSKAEKSLYLPILASVCFRLGHQFFTVDASGFQDGHDALPCPFWAYLLAALATFTVVAYALGWIQGFDKEKVARKFLRFKLVGAVIIGLIFGLVSTPCASAPLVAIITIASQSGWVYSYALVLAFAIGHGMLLLVAGTSLGFTQSVVSSKKISSLSRFINGFFIVILVGIGIYFLYQTYLVF